MVGMFRMNKTSLHKIVEIGGMAVRAIYSIKYKEEYNNIERLQWVTLETCGN